MRHSVDLPLSPSLPRLLRSSEKPDARLSWRSYRERVRRHQRERGNKKRRGEVQSGPNGQLASGLNRHRLSRRRLLLASSNRGQTPSLRERRPWNLCWYHTLPQTGVETTGGGYGLEEVLHAIFSSTFESAGLHQELI